MKAFPFSFPNRESLPKTTLDYVSLIFLFLCMLFFLMPLYVMVVTGLKDSTHVSLSTMWNLPTRLTGGGFIEAWQRLLPNLGNSLMLAIPSEYSDSTHSVAAEYPSVRNNLGLDHCARDLRTSDHQSHFPELLCEFAGRIARSRAH